MPIKVFVDESGYKDESPVVVMVGLMANAAQWHRFSAHWDNCLLQSPRVDTFKMRDAAKMNGQWSRFTREQRDKRLTELADIINAHVPRVIYAAFDVKAYTNFVGDAVPKLLRDPWAMAFQMIAVNATRDLWDNGLRDRRFQLSYDDQRVLGPRIHRWYPVLRLIVDEFYPGRSEIMPIDPVFVSDDEFSPVQAADLFAWSIRRGTDLGDDRFQWLFERMDKVGQSKYSFYFDDNYAREASRDAENFLTNGTLSKSVWNKYREVFGDD